MRHRHAQPLGFDPPVWVAAALRPEEELSYDPTVGQWFGVLFGDWTEWRNIRLLTPAAVVEAPISSFHYLAEDHLEHARIARRAA